MKFLLCLKLSFVALLSFFKNISSVPHPSESSVEVDLSWSNWMPDVGSQLMLLEGAECLLKLIVPCKTKVHSRWLPSLHWVHIWNKFVYELSLVGLQNLQGKAVLTGLCGIWYVSGQPAQKPWPRTVFQQVNIIPYLALQKHDSKMH